MFNGFFSVLEPAPAHAPTQATTTVQKVKKELKDIGRDATEAHKEYPGSNIDKAFQGINDTHWKNCYNSAINGYAHIKIEPAEVSEVAFLGRDGYGEYCRQII